MSKFDRQCKVSEKELPSSQSKLSEQQAKINQKGSDLLMEDFWRPNDPDNFFSEAFFGLKAASDSHFDPRKLCYESSSFFSYYTVNYVIQPEVLLNSH